MHTDVIGEPSTGFTRHREGDVTKLRRGEYAEEIRREQTGFRPDLVHRYGRMATEWLTWEAARTGKTIRHQINSPEKGIGKYLVDGLSQETKTAYQFHGYPSCTAGKYVNAVNGKAMNDLFAETRAYLSQFVNVVGMWECECRALKKSPALMIIQCKPSSVNDGRDPRSRVR